MWKKFWKSLLCWLRIGIQALGMLMLTIIGLSFTDLPWHAYYYLGTSQIDRRIEADHIIVLGSGAVPGYHALLRCWYAARAAHQLPEAMLIVALPSDTNAENDDHRLMREELILRGVSPHRILSEKRGYNTYQQAKNIRQMLDKTDAKLLLVTSPEHMFRSIKTFRKAGFESVNGLPTFEAAFDSKLLLAPGSKTSPMAKPVDNLDLRYNMWSYMQYQIIVLREYVAIAWYELNGMM